MIEKIKIMLGIETENIEKDEILKIMIEDTTTAILNYCNIKQLPEQLEYIIKDIVINTFMLNSDGNIASIKRGDTQITYKSMIDINSFNNKHISALNRFRKINVR